MCKTLAKNPETFAVLYTSYSLSVFLRDMLRIMQTTMIFVGIQRV